MLFYNGLYLHTLSNFRKNEVKFNLHDSIMNNNVVFCIFFFTMHDTFILNLEFLSCIFFFSFFYASTLR